MTWVSFGERVVKEATASSGLVENENSALGGEPSPVQPNKSEIHIER